MILLTVGHASYYSIVRDLCETESSTASPCEQKNSEETESSGMQDDKLNSSGWVRFLPRRSARISPLPVGCNGAPGLVD